MSTNRDSCEPTITRGPIVADGDHNPHWIRHSAFPLCRSSLRALGAKLGAIRCGLLRTAMDGCGLRTGWLRTVWTAADGHGRSASIYGSEGWGFEFLRACQRALPSDGESLSVSAHRGAVLAHLAMPAISHSLGDRVCDLHPVLLGDHDTGRAYVPISAGSWRESRFGFRPGVVSASAT